MFCIQPLYIEYIFTPKMPSTQVWIPSSCSIETIKRHLDRYTQRYRSKLLNPYILQEWCNHLTPCFWHQRDSYIISYEEARILSVSRIASNPLDRALQRLDHAFATNIHTCSICLQTIPIDTPITRLPCQHVYHMHCIRPWLQRRLTCPYCRRSI